MYDVNGQPEQPQMTSTSAWMQSCHWSASTCRRRTGWTESQVGCSRHRCSMPKLCDDVVLLNNRIQTKAIVAEQYEKLWRYTLLFWQWNTQSRPIGCPKRTKKPIQHVSLNEIDIQSQRLAENVLNHASILLSNRIQLFFRCAMDFQLSQWWPPSICFWLPILRFCRFANGSRRPSYTRNPAGYPKCSNLKD